MAPNSNVTLTQVERIDLLPALPWCLTVSPTAKYTDRIVNVTVAMQRRVTTIQTVQQQRQLLVIQKVQKTVEVPQVQYSVKEHSYPCATDCGVVNVIPQERVSERTVEQIVDVPVIREQQVLTIQKTVPWCCLLSDGDRQGHVRQSGDDIGVPKQLKDKIHRLDDMI